MSKKIQRSFNFSIFLLVSQLRCRKFNLVISPCHLVALAKFARCDVQKVYLCLFHQLYRTKSSNYLQKYFIKRILSTAKQLWYEQMKCHLLIPRFISNDRCKTGRNNVIPVPLFIMITTCGKQLITYPVDSTSLAIHMPRFARILHLPNYQLSMVQ